MFIYNASGTLVAEYSTALATTPQVSYLTTDHLGSPRVVTNEAGTVKDRKDFSAFGEESITAQRTSNAEYSAADQMRKNYTGYEKDGESGLEFAQARYYNPTHGRYTSVDPLTASASIRDPQTFNRYSYVLNSPYKFVDPLGLISSSTGANGGYCSASRSSCDEGEDLTTASIEAYQKQQQEKEKKREEEKRKKAQEKRTNKQNAKKPQKPPAQSGTERQPDVFDTGLGSVKKAGASAPTRAKIVDEKDTNTPTTVRKDLVYQVLDQYGNPYTGPGAGSLNGEVMSVLEEITPLPSVCSVAGCNAADIKTGATELDSDGQFTDTLMTTTSPTGIRIPDDTSIRSLQRIFIVDLNTGASTNIRLNLIEITRQGVKITDISETGTKVPRK